MTENNKQTENKPSRQKAVSLRTSLEEYKLIESASKINIEDLKKFKADLLNDKILKQNGKPYSDETKEDCTETICRYLEVNYPKKIGSWATPLMPFKKWFVIRASKKTPETLTEDEINKLYDSCKTMDGKFLIAVLFDAGCRIEEFANIRFEDIETPTSNFPYYKIDFKEEYSKTEGRKIGLYWAKSTKAISDYLQICDKKDSKEAVFNKNYDAMRMFLYRLGKKVLNKDVNPHMIRKSSATYYASKLNRQQLCVRYGWKFSSEMPDIYISRAGVDEGKVKEVMFNDDLNVMKKETNEQKTKLDIANKEIETVKKALTKMTKLTTLLVENRLGKMEDKDFVLQSYNLLKEVNPTELEKIYKKS